MKTVALTLTFIATLFLIGCQTKNASPVNMEAGPDDVALSFTLPLSISSERILELTESSLQNRAWKNITVSGNQVQATLSHRGIDASLRVVVEGSTVNIFSDSWRLDDKGNRKYREHPEGWIRNLEKDIRAGLGVGLM